MLVGEAAGNGPAGIARHVIGWHVPQDTRVQHAIDDVPGDVSQALAGGDRGQRGAPCVSAHGRGGGDGGAGPQRARAARRALHASVPRAAVLLAGGRRAARARHTVGSTQIGWGGSNGDFNFLDLMDGLSYKLQCRSDCLTRQADKCTSEGLLTQTP